MTNLTFRILQLAYRLKRAHIGSALTAAPILDEIYSLRRPDEPMILSAGHAFLGLACVLERHLDKSAEDLLRRHGVHPVKNEADGIYCSTGSLGQGLSVAIGRALADRNRRVWVYITDGEAREGVVYEALTFARQAQLWNLKIYCGWNGWAAYRPTSPYVRNGLNAIFPIGSRHARPDDHDIPFIRGQDAHYHVMTEQDWEWVQANRPTTGIQCPDCGGAGYQAHQSSAWQQPEQVPCERCGGDGVVRL